MHTSPHGENSRAVAAQMAVEAFVAVLDAERLPSWVALFHSVATALRGGDIQRAVELYDGISDAGMGGLSDIYATDQPAFDRAWSAVGRAFVALRTEIRT